MIHVCRSDSAVLKDLAENDPAINRRS